MKLMPLLEKCIVFNFSMSIGVTYMTRHSKEPIFVDLDIKENVYPSTLDVHKKKKSSMTYILFHCTFLFTVIIAGF